MHVCDISTLVNVKLSSAIVEMSHVHVPYLQTHFDHI